jgi:hypothetical protein
MPYVVQKTGFLVNTEQAHGERPMVRDDIGEFDLEP